MTGKRYILLFLLCFCFLSYGTRIANSENLTTPLNPESWMIKESNACLPIAIAFTECLRKYNVWCQILAVTYFDVKDGKMRGHSFVIFVYPIGKDTLWTYDSYGSYRVIADKNDPKSIAKQAFSIRNQNRVVINAEYLK